MKKNIPQKGETWRHFKHDKNGPENNYTYEIIGIGFDVKSGENTVIYKPLYTHCSHLKDMNAEFYLRPISDFLKEVDREDFGYTGRRFIKL